MTVETQASGTPIWGDNPRIIDCSKSPATSPNKFDECEKEEVCAKVKTFNEGGKTKVDTNAEPYITNRTVTGPAAQAAFRTDCGAALAGGAPASSMKDKFVAECRYNEWANRKPAPDQGFREPTMLEADHVNELQFGGAPGASNLKWLSERVNGFMGPKLQHYKSSHTGVKPVNCGCD